MNISTEIVKLSKYTFETKKKRFNLFNSTNEHERVHSDNNLMR